MFLSCWSNVFLANPTSTTAITDKSRRQHTKAVVVLFSGAFTQSKMRISGNNQMLLQTPILHSCSVYPLLLHVMAFITTTLYAALCIKIYALAQVVLRGRMLAQSESCGEKKNWRDCVRIFNGKFPTFYRTFTPRAEGLIQRHSPSPAAGVAKLQGAGDEQVYQLCIG